MPYFQNHVILHFLSWKIKSGRSTHHLLFYRGSLEAIRHAQQLITALIKEEKTEHEIAEFIARAQAQAAEIRAAQNKPPPPKPTLTVVAAPIPSKPAWTVPPSIVAHSARQVGRVYRVMSFFKVQNYALHSR